MLKLILKNIWSHRGRNLLVLIELVLITFVAWVVIEPVVVYEYVQGRKPGYDIDRLVRMELAMKYNDENYTSDDAQNDINRILANLRSNPQVEAVTITHPQCFEAVTMNVTSFPPDIADGFYVEIRFIPGTDFFKTFGICDAVTGKIFNEPPCNKDDVVVSRSVAEIMHPGENALGHYINEHSTKFDWDKNKRIVGIVDDAIYRSYYGRTAIVYKSMSPKDVSKFFNWPTNASIVIRLKPGITPVNFIRKNGENIHTELVSGPLYAHSPVAYTEVRDILAMPVNNENMIKTALVLFLIVNLCLGVIGTFYLQTRSRCRDAGVMKAFGATPGSICRNMIAEGWLLAIVSWIIGCGAAWYRVRNEGLTEVNMFGERSQSVMDVIPLWIDDFSTHFGVISLIVLALLLITVTIGIFVPAYRISRVNPVDALREID